VLVIILAVLAAAGIVSALAVAAWSFFKGRVDGTKLEAAGERAKELVSHAEEEQRKLILAAQEEALKLRAAGENEVKEQRQELNRMERRYMQREEQLERKTEALERQQSELAEKQGEVQRVHGEAEVLKNQQLQTLEEIASLSVADARQLVVKRGEEEAQHDLQRRYYELEKESKEKADENARRIITLAINRLATDVVSEVTTSVVSPPRRIGIVGRPDHGQSLIQVGYHLLLVPNVIARCENVHAAVQELVGRINGETKAAGGILPIGDDQVDSVLQAHVGHQAANGLPAGLPDNVPDH